MAIFVNNNPSSYKIWAYCLTIGYYIFEKGISLIISNVLSVDIKFESDENKSKQVFNENLVFTMKSGQSFELRKNVKNKQYKNIRL